MKKFILLLMSFAVITLAAQAKIWRVNNNPGVVADFTTAQAAHDAASNGDIIHLEPSPTSYGNLECTKPLTWVSIGAFLSSHPGLQYSSEIGKIENLTFNAGSSGSVAHVYCTGGITIITHSITLNRSFWGSYSLDVYWGGYNTTITQCYSNVGANLRTSNTVFTNNIVRDITTDGGFSGIIANNVLTNDVASGNIYNATFQNNISRGFSFTFYNSTVSHNMKAGSTGLPTGNNNILNANMADVFVNPDYGHLRVDKDFLLKAGSPAISAGYDGVDMGAFGGATPFVLGLQPAIPAITSMNAPAATSAGSINVVINAKSNQ
jgi:hypothetical protein